MKRKAAALLEIEISVRLQDLQRRKHGVAPLNLDEVTAVDENLSALLAIAQAFDTDAQALDADTDLSQSGKEKAREKLARAALQKLADFETAHVTKPRETAAGFVERALDRGEPRFPEDPQVREVFVAQLRTLWATFEKADPLELDLIAMTTTDPLVLAALHSAPPVLRRPDPHSPRTLMPLVNPERIAAANLARARSLNPEGAAYVERIERLAECYAGAIGGVRSAILEQVAPADPIAAQAAGAA